ncbi:MAG: thrombospondin type 3 repeat-containing protein [Candidatus Pacebacteria bacterium]|nr:thrombospondin type 3 repeat-containing protein [Candidatus Paceibacterota bacterium]
MKEELIVVALTFFLLSASFVFAAVDTAHIGFVRSTIWFDREPFFSGETVRVYTTLANSTPADFRGVVEFYDGDTSFGTTDVSLERNGGFQTVWTDWEPTEGDHAVRVEITSGEVVGPGGKSEALVFDTEPAQTLTRFVDTDTDGDRIGNREDSDDDGDGIPDVNDAEPLVAYSELMEEKLEEESTSTPKLQEAAGDLVVRVAEVASSTAPKIQSTAKKTAAVVEEFRVDQKKRVDDQIGVVKERIAEKKAISLESGESKNAPFDQLQLLALTLAGFTFSNTIVFYLAVALLLYVLLMKSAPWIYRKFRGGEQW